MPKLRLVYDLRRAPFSPASSTELVATAIEQCEWADRRGFFQVNFGEHHGSDDGYVPSPLTVLAAVAATKRIRLVPIILAPFYDPVRLAEDMAMVDLISAGRLDPLIGAGYVLSEFAMFGKDLDDRVAAQEESIEVLTKAWTGEPFAYRGTTVRVTSRPHQEPRPLITLGGMSAGPRDGPLVSPTGSRPANPATGNTTRRSAFGSVGNQGRDRGADRHSST